jgi:hypothetical protein
MDFVSAWKIISIGSTGAFGILGLVTEFKDPITKRLTRWGMVSLSGTVFSTLLGTAAQFKEASDQQNSAAHDPAQNPQASRCEDHNYSDVCASAIMAYS